MATLFMAIVTSLCASFGCAANWFDARLIAFGPLITDAGTIIFPLTFIVGDLITEVYGYQYARQAIWIGFFTNIVVML